MWESCHLSDFTRLYAYFLQKIRESLKLTLVSKQNEKVRFLAAPFFPKKGAYKRIIWPKISYLFYFQ